MTRLAGLDLGELRELERSVEREVVLAACHGEPFEDLRRLLTRVQRRVAAHEGDLTPTCERRMMIAAERRV